MNVCISVDVKTEEWKEVNQKKCKSKRRSRKEAKPVYTCLVCMDECMHEDEMQSDMDESVQCETCLKWYHIMCVDYIGTKDWHCSVCTNVY